MSNKKWNKKEAAYLVDNYGKMSLEELSANLGRSVMAVRLYALRHRLDDKHQVVKENRLKKLLEYRFRHLEDFHPSKFFFRETGINQVRYWDLFFGGSQLSRRNTRLLPNISILRFRRHSIPFSLIFSNNKYVRYENQLKLHRERQE